MDIPKVIKILQPDANWALNGDEYEGLVWGSPEIPKPTLAEITAKWEQLEAEKPLKLLRERRDELLQETDWVTLKAYSQGVAVPTEWATYQQALRDLPANTTDPANPTWPTKPS